jgi:hypothetical protein
MPILSRTLLEDLGINLSDADYQSLAEHFESTLEERVINEIVLELSPEQAEQLSHMQESSDDQIVDWVRANVPDFADIVSDEVDILLGELAEDSEKMATDQQQ